MTHTELLTLRLVLALVWMVTGILSFGVYPLSDSLALVRPLGLPENLLVLVVYAGAAADLLMGVLTLCLPRRWLWLAQAALITSYSLLATWLVPEYWLHPFGPLLKNFPILVLLWLLYRHSNRATGATA